MKVPTAKGDKGNGIKSYVLTSGNHAPGTLDTYTITFDDNSTQTVQVYNGANGAGVGDMLKFDYDPTNKNTDAFLLANMVGDSTHRSITDTERTLWNGKQTATETLTAETTVVDADYIPFYDTSASANRKTLWSNIKSLLGAIFLSKSGGDMTGAINEALVSSMALAGTMDIGAAAGNYIIVTAGTGPITSFGTAQAGSRRSLRFSVSATISYNATSMLLPGAANISVVSGDVLTFVSGGGGIWRCVHIQRWVPSDERTFIGAASKLTGIATLTTANWSGSSAPYTYTLTATGILSTDAAVKIGCVTGTNATAGKLIQAAFKLLWTSGINPQFTTNTITFTVDTKPTVDIPIVWEVVR